jgi:hypothetical protein
MKRKIIGSSVVLMMVFSCNLFANKPLTFEERMKAQEAIERVYYNHRIWPKENPQPKPPFEKMVAKEQIEAKVTDCLKKSAALEKYWYRPITGDQLQAEMERMAKATKDPKTLNELFAALNDDPYLIAECLARPILADRLIRNWYASDERFHGEMEYSIDELLKDQDISTEFPRSEASSETIYLPPIPESACTEEWLSSSLTWPGVPDPRYSHFAVWTGTEMVVWCGSGGLNSGGRYNPSTDTWEPTSTGTNCPSSREYCTVVWTGTEMIVWGGYKSAFLNTGGKYNPASDTWTATSAGANCPAGREYHSAVWTGTEMIVWGGYGSSPTYKNDGGRYNPSTDMWTAVSTGTDCPAARRIHSAVWTGTRMIIWGGSGSSGAINSGGIYNPSNDSWVATSTGTDCPAGRTYFAAIWTGSEMIIWGGGYNSGGKYNPSSDTWVPTSTGANCPAAESSNTAVWTGTEMIIWGGYMLNTGGRYNPQSDTWQATSTGANCPSERRWHTAVWTGSEMIVWGGCHVGSKECLNTGGRYNPASDTWVPTSTGAGPLARASHSAVWTGTEMIIWGGWGASAFNSGGRYTPATDSWTTTSRGINCPDGREYHTAIWTGSEMIVWGGDDRYYDGSAWHYTFFNNGGRYDPLLDGWTATPTGANCPSVRSYHTVIWTGAKMVVWGGYDGNYLGSGGLYDPAADTWAATAAFLSPRTYHTAVWTGSLIIIWGGYDGSSYLNSGGCYDPSANSWYSTSIGTNCPAGRSDHTAVWTGAEMIIWGGYHFSGMPVSYNTGGKYDPVSNSWTATSAGTNCPSNRANHTAVWTGTNMLVWGGYSYASSYSALSTGGKYNPSADTWQSTATGVNCPYARYDHTAVWTGTEMIVWGNNFPTSTGGIYNAANAPAEVSYQGACDWGAIPGTDGYRVYRGTYTDLPNLMNLNPDGCVRYQGASTSFDCSGDDPSLVADRLYWYLVTAYTGTCEGSAGEGTGFTRDLSSKGICP